MRYHYKPIRRMKIKKTHHPQYWWECGVTRTFMHCCWDYKKLLPFCNSLTVSYQVEQIFAIWYSNPMLRYLPQMEKKKKRYIHLKACSWMLLAAFLQQPKPGNNPNADQLGWMDKQIKWNTSMIKRNKLLIYAPIRINLKALF